MIRHMASTVKFIYNKRMKLIVFIITFIIAYFGGGLVLCVDSGESPNSFPKFCSEY